MSIAAGKALLPWRSLPLAAVLRSTTVLLTVCRCVNTDTGQASPGRVSLRRLEMHFLPCVSLQPTLPLVCTTLPPVLRRCFDTDTAAAVPQAVFEKNLRTLQDLSANPRSPVTYSSYERLATDKIKHRRGQYEAPSAYNMPVTTQQVTLQAHSDEVMPGLTTPSS